MQRPIRRWLSVAALVGALLAMGAGVALGVNGDDTPTLRAGAQPLDEQLIGEENEERLLQLDNSFITRRTAGDVPLDNQQAGALRAAAARTAARLKKEGVPTSGPSTFTGAWTQLGPNPIVQVLRSGGPFGAMSGRIGALAIRQDGTWILGGAQGGIWLYNAGTGKWEPKTGAAGGPDIPSLAIGALAVAPSNDSIVYAGTGEGALSGDSYFGNGILKSNDGGNTWSHVSGDYFEGVAISRIVVNPTNANVLYAAVLRGRGGARRTSPSVHSKFGIWKSTDGGASWTLLKEAKSESNGATDLEMDPQSPSILYASFWSDAIYKSTDAGVNWTPINNFGLPSPDFAASLTRFSIAISHPSPGGDGVLYAGFDWIDANGEHPSRVWNSTNGGSSWTELPDGSGGPQGDDDVVEDYCGGQCFYDNVIEADPTNPDIVYAAGQFNYGIGSGGIFRSDDGGQTWLNLGYAQHPDFHAFAFNPDDPAQVLIGSDGGVWYSPDRGGRATTADPLSSVDWQNLNGTVDPATAAVTFRTDLQIAQFSSIATVPTLPARFWGGTQDNGTLRKSTASNSWFDIAGGDGGQVLVNPTDANFVYGTYFSPPATPYRFANGGLAFFSNSAITGGINTTDRSDFYAPWVMNKENTDQLFYGTYRLYRTNNAREQAASAVDWDLISPDLTSGCTGPAPNGARNCTISAIGIGGGNAVYTGALDGYVYVSTNAKVADSPTWTRIGASKLPDRPVSSIAVDRSNYRTAYFAYTGFNAATPSRPGHLFRTKDGGKTFADLSGELPDSPINSVVLDPSFPNTLYVGTDVGPFVTYNGGADWFGLGQTTSFPVVAIWQLDLDSSHRLLAAGTHGRGAFSLSDSVAAPALVISKADAGVPVGPSSSLQYTITLKNEGNATANSVVLTDPVPADTSFISASDGGTVSNGKVTWPAVSISAGGSITRTLTVSIANALKKKVKSITNDGFGATTTVGSPTFSTSGSPVITPIASAFAVGVTPATQTDGARAGDSVDYTVSVKNLGFTADTYNLSSSGGTYTVAFLDATCTSSQTTTPSVSPGASTDVCVRVTVPGGAANGDVNTATVKATSSGDSSVSGSATVKTIAVTFDWLLVDEDGNAPNVQSYYADALTANGISFNTWDLATDPNLPLNYMKAHANIVWFTGTAYPGPIGPYEPKLKDFLDNGGHLFMSGFDILDQAAGTTDFVRDYLHVTWDGSETQNDKATTTISAVTGTLSDGLGTVPLDVSVLGAHFEDRITPNGTAVGIFTDDSSAVDGLSFSDGYKVVFLAFPFEEYGSASNKTALMGRVETFFGP